MSGSSSHADFREADIHGIGWIGEHHGNIYFQSQQNQRPYTANLKYWADRREQERRTRDALDDHFKLSPRRPILFITHGPSSQCPESLSQRLRERVFPEQFKKHLGTDVCKSVEDIRWPIAGKRSVETRIGEYQKALDDALDLGRGFGYPEIGKWIANQRSPVILPSAHIEIAGDDEGATVRAVLDYWAQMVDLDADLTLSVVLSFTYAEPRPTLFDRIRGRISHSSLGAKLAEFDGYLLDRLRVVVLPDLENLKLQDAEDWVRRELKPFDVDREETLSRARSFFDTPDTSIPMRAIADRLGSLIPRDRELMRQQ